jgi:hypothetical protein
MKPAVPVLLFVLLVFASAWVQAATSPDLEQLRSAASEGDPWAQLNLGAAYDHGMGGVVADAETAVRWYRKAAEQGLGKAQFNLAHCLATGHGAPQDYAESRVWMEKAAGQGMADAQFLLGVMLAEGLGGEVDRSQARSWLQRAVQGGNPDADAYLKKLP